MRDLWSDHQKQPKKFQRKGHFSGAFFSASMIDTFFYQTTYLPTYLPTCTYPHHSGAITLNPKKFYRLLLQYHLLYTSNPPTPSPPWAVLNCPGQDYLPNPSAIIMGPHRAVFLLCHPSLRPSSHPQEIIYHL